ncbi:MAG: cobyrinate a,c-diamide synthase [Tissierellia bacterium]|nr:cobyrinate a,c-diamide synthase [Tissierellia bacterium]
MEVRHRLMISATGSNVGKTTVTMGVMDALMRRGLNLCGFKSGPDYIDPMFHRKVLGIPSYNLDLFLMGGDYVRSSLARRSAGCDVAILEGAMGFYDGMGTGSEGSAWDLSQVTETPVLLVVEAAGMGASLAALVSGYANFRENRIIGILINQGNPMLKGYYEKILKEHTGLPLLGILPRVEGASISSRHLGLETAEEIQDLRERIKLLGDAVEEHVDLDLLLELTEVEAMDTPPQGKVANEEVTMAIARDRAFSFYYEDSLEALRERGVRLIPFSPLAGETIPSGVQGVYLGGGYPELHLEELTKNEKFFGDLRSFYEEGGILLAECGGFMTLLEGFQGEEFHPLAGLLPGKVSMTSRLQNFGYTQLTAKRDSLLAGEGERLRAHEFHYSKAELEGGDFQAQKPGREALRTTAYGSHHGYMGYPHIHLASAPQAMERMIQKMKEWKEEHDNEGE